MNPNLRMSAAAGWVNCPSYLEAADLPPPVPESPDDIKVREEGLAAHECVDLIYRGLECPDVASNGIAVDQDMRHHAATMAASYEADSYVEQPLDLSVIYPGMLGTPDQFYIWMKLRKFKLRDFKYGWGYVEVYRNLQLSGYALAVAEAFELADDFKVELEIYQPRLFRHPSRWVTTVGWLRANVLTFLRAAAWEAMAKTGRACPGAWCFDCVGRFTCGAYINQADDLIRSVKQYRQMELSPAALGAELASAQDAMKFIESYVESLQTVIAHKLRNKENVPGWEFSRRVGKEVITPDAAKILADIARTRYGKDVTRLDTVSNIRKQLPSKIVDAFVERTPDTYPLKRLGKFQVERELRK